MTYPEIDAVQAAYEHGLQTRTHAVNGHEVALLPAGIEPQIIDTSDLDEAPRWQKGRPQLHDEGSFIAFSKRYWRAGQSLVLSGIGNNLTTIFDYHEASIEGERLKAGRSEFQANFIPRFTPSWLAWREANGQALTQDELLEFLEDRMGEIVQPDGGILRDVVEFFKVNQQVGFASARNLTNGTVQLQWTEEAVASGGNAASGSLDVPLEFTILLKPFRDLEDQAAFTARLRWRLTRPRVTFTFILRNEELDEYVERLNEQRRLRVGLALAEAGETDPVIFFGNAS